MTRLARLRWRPRRRLAGAFVLTLLPLAAVLAAGLASPPSTFDVQARTEVLELTTGEAVLPRWSLSGARMLVDGEVRETFTGIVQVAGHTRLRFVRVADAPLQVTVERDRAAGTGQASNATAVATLHDLADELVGAARETLAFELRVEASGPHLFPFVGRAVLGDVVLAQTHGPSPILLEGRVRTLGQELLGDALYEARTSELQAGDRLTIKSDDPGDVGHGFVRLTAEARGMQVAHRTDGDSARVTRFGSKGHELGPPWWKRLVSDPVLQVAMTVYATILLGALANATFAGMQAAFREDAGKDGERDDAP